MPKHYPALLAETLEYLAIRPDGKYLDCSAGLGGHTRAMAARLTAGGRLIASDRDPQSLEMAARNTAGVAERVEFQHAQFSELPQRNLTDLDGLLADLGVSLFQLTDPERVFSFQSEG